MFIVQLANIYSYRCKTETVLFLFSCINHGKTIIYGEISEPIPGLRKALGLHLQWLPTNPHMFPCL